MKLLITDICELSPEERAWLEARGLEVIECEDEAPYPGDPSEIDIVACKMLFSYTPIERFTSLKYIQLFMAGFEHIPMDYIASHGIEFHNARDVYSIPIAEFGIGGVLTLYKDFRRFDRQQRGRVWEYERHLRELTRKTVLIVGAGSIGTEFAKRFQAFGCRVIGLARSAGERPYYDEVRSMDKLDDSLPESDIIVMCLPNNAETRHIMGKEQFAEVKPGAVFVNIARGALVDEPALTEALADGRLSGAVLDVFETEPLPQDSPLWAMDNVIAAPHTSFGAEYNQDRLFEVMNRNLEASALLAE